MIFVHLNYVSHEILPLRIIYILTLSRIFVQQLYLNNLMAQRIQLTLITLSQYFSLDEMITFIRNLGHIKLTILSNESKNSIALPKITNCILSSFPFSSNPWSSYREHIYTTLETEPGGTRSTKNYKSKTMDFCTWRSRHILSQAQNMPHEFIYSHLLLENVFSSSNFSICSQFRFCIRHQLFLLLCVRVQTRAQATPFRSTQSPPTNSKVCNPRIYWFKLRLNHTIPCLSKPTPRLYCVC